VGADEAPLRRRVESRAAGPALRVKRVQGHPGIWEITWAPRATFHYGEEIRPGAAAVRAAGLATDALERTGNLSLSVLTGLIRSTAVDLLRALGASGEQARQAVRTAPR